MGIASTVDVGISVVVGVSIGMSIGVWVGVDPRGGVVVLGGGAGSKGCEDQKCDKLVHFGRFLVVGILL